jgi:hypothetical protein
MWNLFEGLLCNKSASINKFKELSKKIAQTGRNERNLYDIFDYYRNRYFSREQEFTNYFENLNFRKNDRRDFVEKTLTSDTPDFESVASTIMIILYRIRNNLFHGLKSIDQLNSQSDNLNKAATALSLLIEAHGHNVVKVA